MMFPHLAEEERVITPLLAQHFTKHEEDEIVNKIVQSLGFECVRHARRLPVASDHGTLRVLAGATARSCRLSRGTSRSGRTTVRCCRCVDACRVVACPAVPRSFMRLALF